MSMKRMAMPAAVLLVAAASMAAIGADSRETTSTCATVIGSEVCTWVVMEGGDPVELGATVPMALVESVPLDAEMVWPPRELATIPLPEEARRTLGLDHLGINWEAHGHPPATFVTPHFDFHFYNVDAAAVAAIDCADASKPAALPDGYALPDIEVPEMGTFVGLCVPKMGMHAMPSDEVHQTNPFGASMMVGYYRAQPIFLEPMVSRDLLLARKDFSLAVPPVSGLPEGVRYPTGFRAEHDEGSDEYRLVFTGFGSG